jgi:hypothetical protein
VRRWLRPPAETAGTAETPAISCRGSRLEVCAVSDTRLPLAEAPSGDPAHWLAGMESFRPAGLPSDRWSGALAVLSDLVDAGVVADALALGWNPLEIIGVQRRPPHDASNVAGLIYSIRPGERVRLLTDRGCTIDTPTGPHRWVRTSLSAAVVAPWELSTGPQHRD